MLPSSDAGAGSEGPGRSGLKRWGPLVAIVAVVVVVGGALLLTSGGGDDEADPTSTTVAPGSFTSADLLGKVREVLDESPASPPTA